MRQHGAYNAHRYARCHADMFGTRGGVKVKVLRRTAFLLISSHPLIFIEIPRSNLNSSINYCLFYSIISLLTFLTSSGDIVYPRFPSKGTLNLNLLNFRNHPPISPLTSTCPFTCVTSRCRSTCCRCEESFWTCIFWSEPHSDYQPLSLLSRLVKLLCQCRANYLLNLKLFFRVSTSWFWLIESLGSREEIKHNLNL